MALYTQGRRFWHCILRVEDYGSTLGVEDSGSTLRVEDYGFVHSG